MSNKDVQMTIRVEASLAKAVENLRREPGSLIRPRSEVLRDVIAAGVEALREKRRKRAYVSAV